MMNMADLDRNAKIDFMEFCYFMRNANFWLSQSVPGAQQLRSRHRLIALLHTLTSPTGAILAQGGPASLQ